MNIVRVYYKKRRKESLIKQQILDISIAVGLTVRAPMQPGVPHWGLWGLPGGCLEKGSGGRGTAEWAEGETGENGDGGEKRKENEYSESGLGKESTHWKVDRLSTPCDGWGFQEQSCWKIDAQRMKAQSIRPWTYWLPQNTFKYYIEILLNELCYFQYIWLYFTQIYNFSIFQITFLTHMINKNLY